MIRKPKKDKLSLPYDDLLHSDGVFVWNVLKTEGDKPLLRQWDFFSSTAKASEFLGYSCDKLGIKFDALRHARSCDYAASLNGITFFRASKICEWVEKGWVRLPQCDPVRSERSHRQKYPWE